MEGQDRKSRMNALRELELPRSLFHVLLVGVWGVRGLAEHHQPLLWFTFFAVVIWEILRRYLPHINRLPMLEFILRRREGRGITPAPFFLLAVLLITNCFTEEVSSTAIFITALADPASRIFGKLFGRHRIGGSRKTWVGTAACFLTAFLVVFALQYFHEHHPLAATVLLGLAAAVTAVIAEVVIPVVAPRLLDDNFWIPLLCAVSIHLVKLAARGALFDNLT
ncbi:MAG: hypothetical protein V2A58_07910 [Planctomycetota bacterium]